MVGGAIVLFSLFLSLKRKKALDRAIEGKGVTGSSNCAYASHSWTASSLVFVLRSGVSRVNFM
jgi:hypothetical protein